jgi:hypothetical protein
VLERTVAAFALASLIVGGCNPELADPGPVLAPLEGDWIRRDTLERLAETRSPRAAASPDVVAFNLTRTPAGFDWTLHVGFHESVLREITGAARQGDEIRLRYDQGTSSDSFVLAGDEIEWVEETSRTRFAPARPSLASLVNRVVLAGRYRDEGNHEFLFTEEGAATWPGLVGRYSISLDSEDDSCDALVLESPGETITFGFRFEGTRLLLFREEDGGALGCSGSPSLSLEKR